MKFQHKAISLYVALQVTASIQPIWGQSPEFEEFALINTRFEPYGNLVNLGDGYLYGAARWAESAKGGVIYRVAPGQDAEIVHEFASVADGSETNQGGSHPSSPLVAGPDGALYGSTDSGGAHASGTIYRVSPDGVFSVLHDNRYGVVESLLVMPDGRIVAASTLGGDEGEGAIIESGPDGLFRMVSSFPKAPSFPPFEPLPEGSRSPFRAPAGLILGSDGAIYGTFSQGGLIYPHGSFRFTYGAMFRHDGPGQEVILHENPRVGDRAVPHLAVEDGFISVTGDKLVRISLTGQITHLATFDEPPSFPSVCAVQGDAIYGMSFYGGEHLAGYYFRYTPEEGIVIIHQFTRDYYSMQRSLTVGNDGMVYGIAALPKEGITEEPAAAGVASMSAETAARAKDKKKGSKGEPARAFRFRPPGSSANFVPVAKPDFAWLPAKAKGGARTIDVDVLKNDRDPDRNPLTLVGLGEGSDPSLATIVDTPKGKRLRISTTEADPASRLVTYQVADGQGGVATGRLSVKSPLTGKFSGIASGTDAADAPLTIAIGKNLTATASLKLNGKTYKGKGQLDIDETGDINLKAKGSPAVILHIDLKRVPERRIQAIFEASGTTYSGACEPKTKK